MNTMINLHPTQVVNILAKYIYKNLDGRQKFKIGMNTCDIYFTVYYQVPEISVYPGDDISYSDIYEMNLNINITTYQNSIRINIYEISPLETTIGFLKYKLDQFYDIQQLKIQCMNDIKKKVTMRYNKYEFIF